MFAANCNNHHRTAVFDRIDWLSVNEFRDGGDVMVQIRQWLLRCLVIASSSLVVIHIGLAQESTKRAPDPTTQDATRVARQYRPIEGQPHPDFVLPSIDDQHLVQLSGFRGKKVLLLHFASW